MPPATSASGPANSIGTADPFIKRGLVMNQKPWTSETSGPTKYLTLTSGWAVFPVKVYQLQARDVACPMIGVGFGGHGSR